MRKIIVKRSADPTFMHNVLTHWTQCIDRYHHFHTPAPHDPDHGKFIWDSINGQYERSHVGVFSAAAWLAGGISIVEVGKREEGSNRARCGDIYMCSPAYVAFEGEAKPFDVDESDRDKARFTNRLKNLIGDARVQHEKVLKREYDYSPIYLIFIRTVDPNPDLARILFETCITHLIALTKIENSLVSAFASAPTTSVLPIKWDKKNYHSGSIVCVCEDEFFRHAKH